MLIELPLSSNLRSSKNNKIQFNLNFVKRIKTFDDIDAWSV